MKVSLFDYHLPADCIAQYPTHPRDMSRMLVVGDERKDASVRDLPDFLQPGDVLVLNDTKVIPARLFGKRGDAAVELLLHRKQGRGSWEAFAKPAKKLKQGDTIVIAPDFTAKVLDKHPDGLISVYFEGDEAEVMRKLQTHGVAPLPPYIKREKARDEDDINEYQTLYARAEGSVAAPTAGLHFTESLMASLNNKGVQVAFVTLHVGAGTFLPVKTDDTDTHVMHAEWAEVSEETAAIVNKAKAEDRRIVAVGTTSLRTLESAAAGQGRLQPFAGDTRLFITPGYQFKLVDVLLTNFHLPRSTLFMLVCAFAGTARMQEAYNYAITTGYRFYSYGDACLLTKND